MLTWGNTLSFSRVTIPAKRRGIIYMKAFSVFEKDQPKIIAEKKEYFS